MVALIVIWVFLLAICSNMARWPASGPLVLAYFLGLSLIHVPGAINALGDGSALVEYDETQIGFKVTIAGLAAFLMGVATYRLLKRNVRKRLLTKGRGNFGVVARRLIVMGCVAYFVALPISGLVPSLTSLISALGGLLVLGYWAWLKHAEMTRDKRQTALLFLSIPLLPLSTLAAGGFAGFGIYWSISVVSLYWQLTRIRWLLILLAPLIAWLGLSFGVAYFAGRDLVREAVWQENAGLERRLDRIFRIFDHFEIYRLDNALHVEAINNRLNQNFFVGLSVMRIENGQVELAYGNTVPYWFLVPRVVWPEKPPIGGGRDVVAKFTGIWFNDITSVGAGQPLEFFVNFGWLGIIFGYLVWGIVLQHIDQGLARGLREGDVRQILVFGLPGLAFLQPGGNLLEIFVSVVASVIASRVVAVLYQHITLTRDSVDAARIRA